MTKPTKIIFAGTPEFAVPYLQSLIDDVDFEVAGVITQPDRPVGRKQILTPPPVKILANESNLNILQPEDLKGEKIEKQLKDLGADILVVVAYGQIIPQNILDLFPERAINVHPSLLPKYRGASPMQSAILRGDKKTGVSIMMMDSKMDHGPILDQIGIKLSGDETAEDLHNKVAEESPKFLMRTIKKYLNGNIKPKEQDHSQATFCKEINKENAKIDWELSAQEISNKIRGYFPSPTAWTTMEGKRLKIFPPVEVMKTLEHKNIKTTGEINIANSKLQVQCGKDSLLINKLQLEGKKPMSAEEFIRGNKDINGIILK